MQKIKNLLHHNQDANHNGIPDSQERTTTTANRTLAKDPIVHDHGTTLPNTVIPPTNAATTTVTSTSTLGGNALGNDRNMNGIPDNLEGGRHFNPLDRNHDGKVSLADLKPGAKREAALRDANAAGLSNDRNMNGIPDNLERTTGLGATGLSNDRNMNGIPDNLERRHNPLDRNGDGRVDLKDLTGRPATGLSNDRNMNGIPDNLERGSLLSNDRNMNGIPDNLERTTGLGATGLSNDRNMNGIPDNLERRHNPLDRNGDGRVDLKDLTGRPGYGQQGLAGGLSNDRNMNGIPDNLERTSGFGTTGLSNDRNMNGIPDNLEYGSASSYGSSVSAVRAEPTVVQVVEKGVVVHEHIHPVEKEEIQPIIYREREQLEVKQITQQLHETAIQPTLVQQRELAAEVRAPIVERGAPIQENVVLPSVDRDATMRSVQVNQPIVNETIKKTVIEEVQPVLERDVFVPTVVQETQPIYEKIVEAPHVYRETLPVRELGTRNADFVQPIVREAPIVAPVAQPHLVQPVTVTTTTTTTDTFIPAKLVATELKSTHVAPTGRKLI